MGKKWHGWTGRILYVDLTSGNCAINDLTDALAYGYLGQSGINARLLYDLTSQGLDPFSPQNPLIFGVGPLTGTLAPCSGRFTVTAKSPLTGVFGDSNCGGHWGPELKQAGYDHIVITGCSPKPVYLWIHDDRVELRRAEHLWGLDTWATDSAIKNELGQDTVQVASIGPAGENKVKIAAIITNLSRAAARTGLGAVMGSKNLKAIAVRGERGITVADPKRFFEEVHAAEEAILHDPLYESARTFGTTAITGLAQLLGFLPTRNFQQSTFHGAEDLRGERILRERVVKHKGCFNCSVSCSRFCRVPDGKYAGTAGEGPEYETISSLGSKCDNGNLDAVLHANMLCNKYGLDTISAGNVIAWAMEAYEKGILPVDTLDHLPEWGNDDAIMELLNKITYRNGLGNILAEGSYGAAEQLGGMEFVIHNKKMDYPAVDVRGTKGMALSFNVSPRGGDHLKGLPLYEVAPEVYQEDIARETGVTITPDFWLRYTDKPRFMAWHENWHCVVDSIGLCKLEGIALKPLLPKHFRNLIHAATGWNVSLHDLEKAGERIWTLERMFNIREGLGRRDDLPPKRLLEEPIATGPSAGTRLLLHDYNTMLDEYYQLRCWDRETGHPTAAKLAELGLG